MTKSITGRRNIFDYMPGRFLGLVGLCAMLVASGASRLLAQSGACQPDTVRFLEQSTFGPAPNLCAHIQNDLGGDFSTFLDEQFNLPGPSYPDFLADFAPYYTDPDGNPVQYGCNQHDNPRYCPQDIPNGAFCAVDGLPNPDRNTCIRLDYTLWPIQQRFFANAANTDASSDQVRQRIAFALTQIWVISAADNNLRLPQRFLPYLQVLDRNAFRNWRDLMGEMTLNPGMGRYLDMVNSRADNPNENYAREVLQLFNVGLDKLNQNGTPITDADGNRLPTYDQETVNNFARAFTGWIFELQPLSGITNYFEPMRPDPNTSRHDQNPKPLLNCQQNPDTGEWESVDDYYPCVVLPGGRSAGQDLQDALDNIFHYPSVGPFIAKNLIQHLVTSNPSPDYVESVAAVFNDNGSGVRGDMKAVIRAILLGAEARNPAPDQNFGHLKEPVLWITNLLRAFNQTSDNTDFVLADRFIPGPPSNLRMDQDLYYSPTVFNYFPPENTIAVPGSDPPVFVLAPEFGIQSTATGLARINFAQQVIFSGIPATGPNGDRPVGTRFDLSSLEDLATDPGQLVEELNQRMLHGTMTDPMRIIVQTAVENIPDRAGRVKEAVYLIATSSQYIVER